MNLLHETVEFLRGVEKVPSDIAHIGNSHFGCTWEKFRVLANLEYHAGFGSAEVATDLVIVFNDGSWLGREEYDGSESWRFYQTPSVPAVPCPIEKVLDVRGMWPSLSELNSQDETEKLY